VVLPHATNPKLIVKLGFGQIDLIVVGHPEDELTAIAQRTAGELFVVVQNVHPNCRCVVSFMRKFEKTV